MVETFTRRRPLSEFRAWKKVAEHRAPVSFELELTARCPNECRHCYIGLPASDPAIRARELTAAEVHRIATEIRELGVLWCLITGGEPLLRNDFPEIYLSLRRQGFLVTVFTTASLVTPEHVRLFTDCRPRGIEVTVYGSTRETYEAVTRRSGSYEAFRRGLERLLEAGLPVTLKAMALKSNVHELDEITKFCKERTKDPFRWDPRLHLRYDGDPGRNAEIRAERLTPAEVVGLEVADPGRRRAVRNTCEYSPRVPGEIGPVRPLFACGAGEGSFTIGWDGTFRLCSSLHYPGSVYDLRRGTVREAREKLVPRVRSMKAADEARFASACGTCRLVAICLWCPANAHLETGRMEAPVLEFCEMAHARAGAAAAASDVESGE